MSDPAGGIVRACCPCGGGFDPKKCYAISGGVRNHFAGTTNVPNHWNSPFLRAYRVAVEVTLPPLPTATYNTGSSFEILIEAGPFTEIPAGSELGTSPLCRLTGNTPVSLVIAEGEFTSGWNGHYFGSPGAAIGVGTLDMSSWDWAAGAPAHHSSVLRVAGWNGVNFTTGALNPVRNRTTLMVPMDGFSGGTPPWGYFWRVVVTRHHEPNHDYGYGHVGDYYWTTVDSVTDELTKYFATPAAVGWAYTYNGGGPDVTLEDPDVRSVLKPESAEMLEWYNPEGVGSVSQSSPTLNASLPAWTTVATGLRATARLQRTGLSDVALDYRVGVDKTTGVRTFTGSPWVFIQNVAYLRVWPFIDLHALQAGSGTLVCLTDLSNTHYTQAVEFTAFYPDAPYPWLQGGGEARLRVALEWIGIVTTEAFIGHPWGVNAGGCHEDGLCDRDVLISPGPPPLYHRRVDCAEPCYSESYGAVLLPRLSYRSLDWGWNVRLLGRCPEL